MDVKLVIRTSVIATATIIMALSSLSTSAGRDHYRWVDDRGNPVHSDRTPPEGVDYDVITTGSSLTRHVDAEEGAVPAKVEPTVGNDFEQIDSKPEEIEKNPEYCKRAQDNLATLNAAPRIRVRNEKGEHRYLNDEEKETERIKAQEAINTHCN
jgi:hypothetical protein